MVEVDAVQRIREAAGVALPADFAVGDDVEARAFLVADGEEGAVVLCGIEPGLGDAPEVGAADPRRRTRRQLFAVDQPLRLRIGADERRRKERGAAP
jgi:hypothetical protein